MKKVYDNIFEEGGGIVYIDEGKYLVFEIPRYGGPEQFIKKCNTFEEAKKVVNSLT